MKKTRKQLEIELKALVTTLDSERHNSFMLKSDFNRLNTLNGELNKRLAEYTHELAALNQKNIALQYALQLMYHQIRNEQKHSERAVQATAGFKFADGQWVTDDKLSLAK